MIDAAVIERFRKAVTVLHHMRVDTVNGDLELSEAETLAVWDGATVGEDLLAERDLLVAEHEAAPGDFWVHERAWRVVEAFTGGEEA